MKQIDLPINANLELEGCYADSIKILSIESSTQECDYYDSDNYDNIVTIKFRMRKEMDMVSGKMSREEQAKYC